MSLPHSTCYLPDGMVAKPPGPSCSAFNLLIPFILSSILGIAFHLLLGRREARNRIRWWNRYYLDSDTVDDRWTPWSALASTIVVIVMAVISAILIRVGGLNIDIFATILLWLTRPRVAWVVIMLDVCLHRSLTETATDLLFQEAVLGVLAIPGSVRMLQGTDIRACDNGYNDLPEIFPTYMGGIGGLISCGAILLFMGVAMLWKMRFLTPLWATLATIPTCGAFVCSWCLWIMFTYLGSDGGFCYSNLAGVAVLQVAVPVINSITRSWIGYSGAY